MKINFYTPPIGKDTFSGGIYCILKHADELALKGHKVNVIPALGGHYPEWINVEANIIVQDKPLSRGRRWGRKLYGKKLLNSTVMQKANSDYFQFSLAPEADVHVATHWSTVEGLMAVENIRRAYFMQHFEPVFEPEGSDSWHKSFMTYAAPVHKIANSTWCKSVVERYLVSQGLRQSVHLATNAIDQTIFYPVDGSKADSTIRIISYGGRGVEWKGFEQMAHAIARARRTLGDDAFEWCVYGDASLPPENSVASYSQLGFLFPEQLAAAYRSSDILLSASWYESYPLFPIEAMACGLSVITSSKGTEDYAVGGENCLIVDPRDVSSIADAVCQLVQDKALRATLSSAAKKVGQSSCWRNASDQMEQVLRRVVSEPQIPIVGRDKFFATI